MSLPKIASLAKVTLTGAAAALFVMAIVPAALAGPAGVDTLRLAAPIAQAHAAGGGHSHRHCHHHGHRNYCHQHHHHPRHH